MQTDLSNTREPIYPEPKNGLIVYRVHHGGIEKSDVAAIRLAFIANLAAFLLLSGPGCLGQNATTISTNDPRGAGYVGDRLCTSCHHQQSSTYVLTAHHSTSSFATKDSILGAFDGPASTLKIQDASPVIGDPGLTYRMEAKGGRFFETAITGFRDRLQSRSESIDVVLGSGVRGQSYLYWQADTLYELPVSYWSDGHQWINSPGYRNGAPNFSRVAIPRCMECHVSYIQVLTPGPGAYRYDKATLVPGIACETCHGPGEVHARLEQTHGSKAHTPSDSRVLNPAGFSRDRQIDLCALCHSGAQQIPLAPTFTYTPGTPLEKYLKPVSVPDDAGPDVHANQVGLLKKSRCFVDSGTMTCSTCHNVHAPERAAASYSEKCLGCHKAESCRMAKSLGAAIKSNCIDCHMPLLQTQAIVSQTADRVIRTAMRTHWIRIYSPDADPAGKP